MLLYDLRLEFIAVAEALMALPAQGLTTRQPGATYYTSISTDCSSELVSADLTSGYCTTTEAFPLESVYLSACTAQLWDTTECSGDPVLTVEAGCTAISGYSSDTSGPWIQSIFLTC